MLALNRQRNVLKTAKAKKLNSFPLNLRVCFAACYNKQKHWHVFFKYIYNHRGPFNSEDISLVEVVALKTINTRFCRTYISQRICPNKVLRCFLMLSCQSGNPSYWWQ